MKAKILVLLIISTASIFPQWMQQTSNSDKSLFNVDFVDKDNGWILAKNATYFLKTNNGGITWSTVNYGYKFTQIQFADKNVGYATCWDLGKGFYKTTNGGNSWVKIFSVNVSWDQGKIFLIDKDNVLFAVGGNLYKTSDGGNSWAIKSFSDIPAKYLGEEVNNIFFLDSNTGWVNYFYDLYFTENGGESWVKIDAPKSREVFFLNKKIGWALSYSNILKTEDGGKTWTSISSMNEGARKIHFLDEKAGFVFYYFYLEKTTDSGKTWEFMYLDNLANHNGYLGDYSIVDENNIWIVGDNGFIAKYTSDKSITVVRPTEKDTVYTNYEFKIEWNQDNLKGYKGKIEYSVDNGNSWFIIHDSIDIGSLNYNWNTKGITSSATCRIKITVYNSEYVFTSNTFPLVKESRKLKLISPKNSDILTGLQKVYVNWQQNYSGSLIRAKSFFYTDTTGNNVGNRYEYLFNNSIELPDFQGFLKLYIYDENNQQVHDESGFIKINYKPEITILSPTIGEKVKSNKDYEIKLQAKGVGKINVEYSTNNGISWTTIVNGFSIDSLSNKSYSYIWNPTFIESPNTLLRIKNNSTADTIDAFSLTTQLVVGKFPLSSGNKWFFKKYDYPYWGNPYTSPNITTIIESLPKVLKEDGKTYSELAFYSTKTDTSKHFEYSGSKFIRQDTNKVYQYYSKDSIKLLCNFEELGLPVNVFGKDLRKYNTLNSLPRDIIADSLGFYYLNYYGGYKEGTTYSFLVGCSLEGNVLGNVLTNYIVSVEENKFSNIPSSYSLSQNYPNPFNPTTTIKYSIPVETRHASSLQHVTLKIYDMLGREITTLVNETKSPGSYEVKFNGSTLPSGIYFYRLQCGDYSETKKLVLLK